MADNFEANAGSGGSTFGADDIGGVLYPRSKIIVGANGVNDGDVSSANPLPIAGAITHSALTSIQSDYGANAAISVNITGSSTNLTVNAHAVTNAGVFAVQVDGNALTSLQLLDDTVFVDDAAFTPGTSKVLAIGAQADEGSTDSVNEGDIGCPRMTLDRMLRVVDTPHTAGGLLMTSAISAATTNAATVKASAGQVYSVHAYNLHTAPIYLKLYNKASAPAPGSDTPVQRFMIPTNGTNGAGFTINFDKGLDFGTGIAYIATTGIGDTDNTATSANIALFNIAYK